MSDEGPLDSGCAAVSVSEVNAGAQLSTQKIFADMQAEVNKLSAAKAPAKGEIAQAMAEAKQAMAVPSAGAESSLAKGGSVTHVNTVKSVVRFGADVVAATHSGVAGAAASALSDALKVADPTAQSLAKLQQALAKAGITNIGPNKTPVTQAVGQLQDNKKTVDSCRYLQNQGINTIYARPGDGVSSDLASKAAFAQQCAARHQSNTIGSDGKADFRQKPLAPTADEAALKVSTNQASNNSMTSDQRQQFNAAAKAAEMKMTAEIADAARNGDINALKSPMPRVAARLTSAAAATVFNFSNQIATNFNRAAAENSTSGVIPPEEKIAPVSIAAAPVKLDMQNGGAPPPTRRLGMSLEMANKLNLLPSLTPKPPAGAYAGGQYALDA